MGQYKSYRDTYLDREIAEIERELIAYKSRQGYGATQIQSRKCSLSSPINSTAVQIYSRTNYFILGKITFSGVNKNKLARGALTWTPSGQTTSWYICESSDEKALNEMKWVFLVQGANSFSVDVLAYMNMDGRLIYESLL